MLIVLLNYIDVSDDVIDVQTINKEMSIGQASIAVTQSTIILNNIERKYDDDYTNSLFYASGWYNKRITIYDTEIKQTVFNGRIKSYEADDKQARIIATNYFKELLDTTCNYTVADKTPAEHIYAIMTSVANIPISNIMYGSYLTAVAEQTSLGIRVNVTITKEHNYDCLQVIQELAKMSCLDIYDNNEVIYMRQWSEYSGVGGYAIYERDIIPGTLKQRYSDMTMFNDVMLAYSTGSAIAYYNAYDNNSKYIYGITKTLKIPDNTSVSTAISDYKIYYKDLTAAIAAATLLLKRYSYPIKYCEIELQSKYNFLQIYDTIDIYPTAGSKEPLQIIKVQNKETSTALQCIYLNKPKQIIEISGAIEPVTIIKGFATNYNAISIIFIDVNDTTAYYELYFRPADGDWVGTDSLQGLSPVRYELTNITTAQGNYIITLTGLKAEAEYQVKIIAYDNAGNKSKESNTFIIRTAPIFDYSYENKFNCKGNILEGISIDVYNAFNGELPDIINNDWILYDSCKYDSNYYSPNSVYETPLFRSNKGFKFFSWLVDAGLNKVKWQYRFYHDGIFSDWSGLHQPADAFYFQCPDGTKGVQFRFVFYSISWNDTDTIYLNTYQEVE